MVWRTRLADRCTRRYSSKQFLEHLEQRWIETEKTRRRQQRNSKSTSKLRFMADLTAMSDALDDACDRWVKAAGSVLQREALLRELELFERDASNPVRDALLCGTFPYCAFPIVGRRRLLPFEMWTPCLTFRDLLASLRVPLCAFATTSLLQFGPLFCRTWTCKLQDNSHIHVPTFDRAGVPRPHYTPHVTTPPYRWGFTR
jgi:hypothetical protein